jgi:hypothetical protein
LGGKRQAQTGDPLRKFVTERFWASKCIQTHFYAPQLKAGSRRFLG